MTVDPTSPLVSAPQVQHGSAGPHQHGHLRAHSRTHAHAHDHGTRAAAPTSAGEPRSSLLMSSALGRLVGAVVLIAVLWATVAWALSGTP